jgi:septal ring factor EnvC (AmiA/AmiB activator)
MSRAIREKASEEKATGPESPVSETRIDPAHPVEADSGQPSARSAPEAFLPQIAPADPTGEPDEVLHRQAGQLAEYLRVRQSELDHRQTRLNAQIAQLESETRAAQLWINEREAELQQRRRELTGRQREVAQRLDRLAAAEDALRRRAGGEGDSPIFPTEKSGQSPSDTQSPESFLQERRRFQEEIQRERQRIAEAEQHALSEVEKKRRALRRRSEHLDRCQASLRTLRSQLLEMHRETLEIRLAAEELWIRMAGAAPPAALTLALERIRGQLADQYRLAGAELAEQRKELETLREELAAQCEAFAAHKKQFAHWATTRRQQLEIQAQRLAEREQLLS